MFKQGDIVKAPMYVSGKCLIVAALPNNMYRLASSRGVLFTAHEQRIQMIKVKKVTSVYQLIRQEVADDNTIEVQVYHGADNRPSIGSLKAVLDWANYLRGLYPKYKYVIFELTITPRGTVAVKTDY